MDYRPDHPQNGTDLMILALSGAEPQFDSVMREFLLQCYTELKARVKGGGLLSYVSLGLTLPWLYRLTFLTRGRSCDATGEIAEVNRHVVALRFLPDYLRRADRFAMLRLVEPSSGIFHPNVASNGAICVEIYPAESLLEICQSLHDVLRWRLRQYDERDALNPVACVWGRENVHHPLDDRPLFGSTVAIQWQPSISTKGL